jgi:hypothetical protein
MILIYLLTHFTIIPGPINGNGISFILTILNLGDKSFFKEAGLKE